MAVIIGHTTRAAGTILTAAIYNEDHLVHITNANALNADINLEHSIALGLNLDGAGAPILTGIVADTPVPFDCDVIAAYVVANQTGTLVIDVWASLFGVFPPTNGNSITAAAPITTAGGLKGSDLVLTGWTTAIPGGSILRWNVDSNDAIQRATVWLEVRKS